MRVAEYITKIIEAPVNKLIDEVDSTGNTVYIGWPEDKNATTAQAKWRILKISKSGFITTFALADGDYAYDNIWDNRNTTVSFPTFVA